MDEPTSTEVAGTPMPAAKHAILQTASLDHMLAAMEEEVTHAQTVRERSQSVPVSSVETQSANGRRRSSFFASLSGASRRTSGTSRRSSARRRSSLAELGWSVVRRSTCDNVLAEERASWERKEQAMAKVSEEWEQKRRHWETDDVKWSFLLGGEGPVPRALTATVHILGILRLHLITENAHAESLLKISSETVGPFAEESTLDEATKQGLLAMRPPAIVALHDAAQASAGGALASSSAARDRALRLAQSIARLEAVETAVRQETTEANKLLGKQRAVLTKLHTATCAAFDELRKGHEKQRELRSRSFQSAPANVQDLWLLCHNFLLCLAAFDHECERISANMAVARDGLLQSADRLWLSSAAALSSTNPNPASTDALATISPAASSLSSAMACSKLAALPSNPFTLRSGVVARRVEGVLKTTWVQEWAVLTIEHKLLLFSSTPSEMAESKGLPRAKAVLSIDCTGSVAVRPYRPPPDQAAAHQRYGHVSSTPSTTRIVLAVPVAPGIWARLGVSRRVGSSGVQDMQEHDLDFGSEMEATRWLEALNGTVGEPNSQSGSGAAPRLSLS